MIIHIIVSYDQNISLKYSENPLESIDFTDPGGGGGRNPITPLSRYDSVSKLLANDITKVIMLGKLIAVAAYILKRSSLVSEEVKSIKF